MRNGLFIALALTFSALGAHAASFLPLGFLPSSEESFAKAISADGTTVVGTSGVEAFRWTAAEGMVGLSDLPGGGATSVALGTSADGSAIVGYGTGSSGQEAVLWTNGNSYGLGSDTDISWSVSADGAVVIGQNSSREAYRWTGSGGLIGLGDLPGGDFASVANGISADGSVIVGAGTSVTGLEAFRWTSAGGMVGLGNLLGVGGRSQAYGVSADGSVVVGYTTSPIGYESFRWTSDTGMVSLGDLAGGSFYNAARAVSADGSVIVGETGSDAFVWTQGGGMQRLLDVLLDRGVTGLDGWRLVDATGISADGRWVVGYGSSPMGTQAFIADLSPVPIVPIPASIVLMSSGLVALRLMYRFRVSS